MIHEHTLPNGLELVISATDAPVVSIHCWVDVGSIDETPEEAGWCHFLEHMLFKGTARRTTAQIAGSIESAGGEMNAFTSFEYTAYHMTLASSRWKLANEVLADMVLGSVFKPGEFAPEKEVILEEIKRGEDSPDRKLYQGMYRMLWGTKGYGRPVIGYPRTVSACTAARLKGFWKKWYAPDIMTVVVSGGVDPTEVLKTINATWGKAKGRAPRLRRRAMGALSVPPIKPVQGRGALEFPVNSVRWAGAYPGVSLADPRLAALDVASSVLGQGNASRLHQRLYRQDQLVTSVGCGVWAPCGDGLLSIEAEVSLEKGGLFKKALLGEIERFREEGPTAEELDRTKAGLESERIYGAQSMESMAHRLGYLKTCMGNAQFDLQYLAQVRELSSRDVREAFDSVVASGDLFEYALVPKGYDEQKLWMGSAATKPKVRPAATKAKKSPATAGKHVMLPNGIELALFPREDMPIVSMQACFLGGIRAESNQNAGLGVLMAELWEKAPKGWTPEHTTRFLESRASRISAFSGKNSAGLSGMTLTKHLDDVLPLFVDMLVSPAMDEKEFDREKAVQMEDIRTFEDSPGRLVDKMFCEAIFDGHPYANPVVGSSESVAALSLDSVREQFKRLSSGRVAVAVAGKFDVDRLTEHFGRLKRDDVTSDLGRQLAWQQPRGERVVERAKNREQSHLIMGFPGLRLADKDRVAMKVLMTLLGGQSGRLFRELRDKKGLCYVVAPVSFEGWEAGYFGVYMGCDPAKRRQALSGIKGELERLVSRPIPEGEVKRAKEFMLGRHAMDLQLNSTIASLASLNTLYNLGFDEHLRLASQLKAITGASLRKLAARLVDQPPVTAVVI